MTYAEELYKTPEILEKVLIDNNKRITGKRIVFCGCGTSFYIGGQAAKICHYTGVNAVSADAIDIIEKNSIIRKDDVAVFISRSGNSMETILAMEESKRRGAKTFYIGCTERSALHSNCDDSCVIPYANEENILESYSYYAQLVLSCICCGVPVSKTLPDIIRKEFDLANQYYKEAVESRTIKKIISLGSPFYMPQLREMMLKDGEITQLPAENWGVLEFRHGPRSWADEYSLIELIPGTISEKWDEKVAAELVSYGCNLRYYSSDKLPGAYSYFFGLKKYSIEESVALAAFHVCVAALIGQREKTKPEMLRHVVHNVGEL